MYREVSCTRMMVSFIVIQSQLHLERNPAERCVLVRHEFDYSLWCISEWPNRVFIICNK